MTNALDNLIKVPTIVLIAAPSVYIRELCFGNLLRLQLSLYRVPVVQEL